MRYKKVVIIGTGLIGGSIGKALIRKKLAGEVVGVCRRRSTLKRAIREGVFTKGCIDDYAKVVPGADVVFIATPVETIKEVLYKLSKVLKDGRTIVTDVGSTKKEIVRYAERYRKNFSFVGAHPLAGSEKAGVEYAHAGLFADSLCILTPTGKTSARALATIKDFWKNMGAQVDILSPGRHDRILSFTSHLPHVVAYALSGAQEKEFYRYMATGFRDTTRVASSAPRLWAEIFLSNGTELLKAVRKFKGLMDSLAADIRKKRKTALKTKLERCKRIRDDAFGQQI